MNLKVGDSVLYLYDSPRDGAKEHTGIIMDITPKDDYPYHVYWINDQWTREDYKEISEYRKQYLQILHWSSK